VLIDLSYVMSDASVALYRTTGLLECSVMMEDAQNTHFVNSVLPNNPSRV